MQNQLKANQFSYYVEVQKRVPEILNILTKYLQWHFLYLQEIYLKIFLFDLLNIHRYLKLTFTFL